MKNLFIFFIFLLINYTFAQCDIELIDDNPNTKKKTTLKCHKENILCSQIDMECSEPIFLIGIYNPYQCTIYKNYDKYDEKKKKFVEQGLNCSEKQENYKGCYEKCMNGKTDNLNNRTQCCLLCNHSSQC